MKTLPALVFFGSDDFSASMLERLLTHDFFKSNLKYVVTKTPQKKGRGRTLTSTAVERVAVTIPKITLLHANTKTELDEVIGKLATPLVGVLVSYGVIVSPLVLNKFAPGLINFHPSLLPRHRGPSPVENAILQGDNKTGVSVMKLEPAMDAGPIYAQKSITLDGTETPALLYQRIINETADWFATQLNAIFNGDIAATPQDDSLATYTSIIKKQHGILQPESKTATDLEREIRAYQGYPKSRANLGGQDIIITKAHVALNTSDSELTIACKDNTLLAVDELITPNGKKMPASAYLHGLRNRS